MTTESTAAIDEKAAKKTARAAARQERRAAASAKLSELAMNARFEGWALTGSTLRRGFTVHDITGAVAEFQHGANIGSRITVTRLALVGIFAFGLKKDRNKVYVLIRLADGEQVLIEAKAKQEADARKFTAAINKAAAHYA